MGQPAARMGDLAGHGGIIVFGEPTVLIGGLPAARKGDPLVCPVPMHGGGVITQGSMTVLIGGMPAARMGDLTGCLTVGMSGISIPTLLGPVPALPALPEAPPLKGALNADRRNTGMLHDETDKGRGGVTALHAEGQVVDSDKDGSYDTVESAAEAVRMRNSAYGNAGPVEGGITHNMDVFYASGKGTSRAGYGYGASGTAETGMMKWGAGGSVAPANSNGRNPYAAVGGEANMFHAKAEGDVLIGNDGNRSGLIAKGEAGAEVLQGEVAGTTTTPSIFGFNIQGKGKVGASAASVAIGGGGWLYYDHSEGRLHAGVSGKIAALFGIEGEIDVSAGRAYSDPGSTSAVAAPVVSPTEISFITIPGFGAGGIPGVVTLGCFTVLIG